MIAVRAAARALMDRIAPGAVILLYHRVADLDFDPQLLAVSRARFAEQLEMMSRAATPVPLSELQSSAKRRRGVFAVTFDDGYADNFENARPELERRGIPATVFVSSGYVASGREFWWDELERIFLRPNRLPSELTLPGGRYPIAPAEYTASDFERHRAWNVEQRTDPTPRHAVYRTLLALLGNASVDEREQLLAHLRAWASSPEPARPSHRPMTADEVRALRSNAITVGAHTVSHPRLSAIDAGAQERELAGSRRELESLTGAPVRLFAYPFGGRTDYSRQSVELARATFDLACSNFPGSVRAGTPSFELPRFLVRDWPAEELRARVPLR